MATAWLCVLCLSLPDLCRADVELVMALIFRLAWLVVAGTPVLIHLQHLPLIST